LESDGSLRFACACAVNVSDDPLEILLGRFSPAGYKDFLIFACACALNVSDDP